MEPCEHYDGSKVSKYIMLSVNGVSYDDPRTVADILANHFTTIAETSPKLYYKDTLSSSCTTSSMLNVNFNSHPILEDEVIDVLR